MRHPTIDQIIAATEDNLKWRVRDRITFHVLSPAGLIAKKRACDQRISDAVDKGACASGAIIAYGGFNNYTSETLIGLASKERRVPRVRLQALLMMLRDDIQMAEAFLSTLKQ